MSESKVKQIKAGLKTEIEAIAGDNGTTYWYTPDKVVRVDSFDSRQNFRDGYGDYIYLIRDTPNEDENIGMAAFSGMAHDLDIWLLLMARDKLGDIDPFTATTLKGDVREKMIQDVRKMLENDVTRGGLALNTARYYIMRDFEDEPQGWIVAEISCVITYTHTRGDP